MNNCAADSRECSRDWQALESALVAVFDGCPLDAQPACVVVTGCAGEDLLERIRRVIVEECRRGQSLDRYPLRLLAVVAGDPTRGRRIELALQPLIGSCHFVAKHDSVEPARFVERLAKRFEVSPGAVLCIHASTDGLKSAHERLLRHLRGWARIVGPHGFLALESHASTRTLEEYLLTAGGVGLFPRYNSFGAHRVEGHEGWITLCHFERRPYNVRQALQKDLEDLCILERRCWPAGSRASRRILRRRIATHQSGQLVLEHDDQVIGAIYSQRIANPDAITGRHCNDVHEIHRGGAPVVQILALNILPQMQDRGFGDQLLEFALQRCSVIQDLAAIVGVTRCKDYSRHAQVSLDEYVQRRTQQGSLMDPVLRMHERHGARIRGLVRNYRPNDVAGGRDGVLVEYDPERLRRFGNGNETERVARRTGLDRQSSRLARSQESLVAIVTALLSDSTVRVSTTQPFMELGLTSADLLVLGERLLEHFDFRVEPSVLYEHNTINKLAAYVDERIAGLVRATEPGPRVSSIRLRAIDKGVDSARDVAIVGLAVRLPCGITTCRSLWELLVQGKSAITRLPPDRWLWPSDIDPVERHRGIDFGGFLESIDNFDAAFFRISPREAQLMDPQQRLLLELSWHCLEEAGRKPAQLAGRKIGVYIGASGCDYQRRLAESGAEIGGHSGLATSMAIVANRLSYFYDFCGPSLQIDTACSSSLVAVEQAVQALRSGACESALVGGVHVMCHPANSIAYYKAGMLSKEGRCRTFDRAAGGYVRAEGAVMMLLKPVANARADRDRIRAVIKGVAVNHGGKAAGLTAPNPGRQADLIVQALTDADVNPATIGYVEAHGTGTSLGDPIEIRGLKEAFARLGQGSAGKAAASCGLGSIKTNLGHLEAAAGITSLLKVVLSMQYRKLPASINFEELNPQITLVGTPFYIVDETRVWRDDSHAPRRACVSSFGSGGTNAHVVVEEYLVDEVVKDVGRAGDVPCPMLVLSARSSGQLRQQALDLLAAIEHDNVTDDDLPNIAYTLQVGRDSMAHRLAFTATSLAQINEKLTAFLEGKKAARGEIEGFYHGELKHGNEDSTLFPADEALQGTASEWIERGQVEKILALWVDGLPVEWERLYAEGCAYAAIKPRRISLPTYPFVRERYWALSAGTGSDRQEGLASRRLEAQPSGATVQLLQPRWLVEAVHTEDSGAVCAEHWVMLCEVGEDRPERLRAVQAQLSQVRCLELKSAAGDVADRFGDCAQQLLRAVQGIVAEKSAGAVRLQLVVPVEGEAGLTRALSGLLVSAAREHPKLKPQVIAFERDMAPAVLIERLLAEAGSAALEVRYNRGERQVRHWEAVRPSGHSAKAPWKAGGVYLITGGLGGLGLIFAREIAACVADVTLILAGRSAPSEAKEERLAQLRSQGARVEYRRVDVTDAEEVARLIEGIQAAHGRLSGILHAAGVLRDSLLMKKTAQELRAVLGPKVAGVIHLDAATRDLTLEHFILFSSTSAARGNVGQSDYAAANAFLDVFAEHRNRLVQQGARCGHTLSINWPLWEQGGMQVDQATREWLSRETGLVALASGAGVEAFYRALELSASQVLVWSGEPRGIGLTSAEVAPLEVSSAATPVPRVDIAQLCGKLESALVGVVADLLKIKREHIDAQMQLREFGFDSINLTAFSNRLNEIWKLSLTPAVFFEYPTLQALADHLVREHEAVFLQWHRPVGASAASATPVAVGTGVGRMVTPKRVARTRALDGPMAAAAAGTSESIAIIGAVGCFPGAASVAAFWESLKEGRSAITEIPVERWDWRAWYGDPAHEANKTDVKWGGFIEEVDRFDPLFFGISPREAELMDPQQRLLMSYVWKVIEDAGYSARSLSGSKTGVFVGTMNSGYDEIIAAAQMAIDGYSSTGAAPSIGPNRMSYFLNLHGPSEPVDTACSSSLVAIHRAVRAIEGGECDQAIVGGVNTILSPAVHVSFSKAGMLCEDGRCKAFSREANGYVRGEGVGMLFLKKRSAAERAHDHIYGLIRGSAQNHGGRAASLTAPNPKAQAELIKAALNKAGIDARTVSYIETHGTGTSLGDPIEINGLKSAFKDLYALTGQSTVSAAHCGLGSVKSNIGHLELAAGVAGVIKVLLQLKHRTLVKSLHCEQLNPYIDLSDSPFYIVQSERPWEALRDANGRELPRRAGVSSFGFGGVNAHVVIEEYVEDEVRAPEYTPSAQRPALVVLSARNEARLQEQARNLQAVLEGQQFGDPDLGNIAYTLQVGRDGMEHRLAFTAATVSQVKEKLAAFLQGNAARAPSEDFYHGEVKRERETWATLNADEDTIQLVTSWLHKGKFSKLLDLWVKGLAFDWELLYGPDSPYAQTRPRRVSLPTYPFAPERYWIPLAEAAMLAPQAGVGDAEHDSFPLQVQEGPRIQGGAGMDVDPVVAHEGLFNRVEIALVHHISRMMKLRVQDVDVDAQLSGLGVDSIGLMLLVSELSEEYGFELPPLLFLEYSTIRGAVDYLIQEYGELLARKFPSAVAQPVREPAAAPI